MADPTPEKRTITELELERKLSPVNPTWKTVFRVDNIDDAKKAVRRLEGLSTDFAREVLNVASRNLDNLTPDFIAESHLKLIGIIDRVVGDDVRDSLITEYFDVYDRNTGRKTQVNIEGRLDILRESAETRIRDQEMAAAARAGVNAPFPFDFDTHIPQEDSFIINNLEQKINPTEFGLPAGIKTRELRNILSKNSMENFVRLLASPDAQERLAGQQGLRLITLLLGTGFENAAGTPGTIAVLQGYIERMELANVPTEIIETTKLIYHSSALDYAAIKAQDSSKDFIEIYEKQAGPDDDNDRQTIKQFAAALYGDRRPDHLRPPYLTEAQKLMEWINSPKIMFQLMLKGKDPYLFLTDKLNEYATSLRENAANPNRPITISNIDIGGNQVIRFPDHITPAEIKLSLMVVKNIMIGNHLKEWWMKRTIVREDTRQNGQPLSTYRVLRPGEKEPRGRNIIIVKNPKWFVSAPAHSLVDLRTFVTGVKKRYADFFPGSTKDHKKESPVAYHELMFNADGRVFKPHGEQLLDLAYFGETTSLNTYADTTTDIYGKEHPMKWPNWRGPVPVTEVMAGDFPDCKVDPTKQWKFMKKIHNALLIVSGLTEVVPVKLGEVLAKEGIPVFEYAAVAGGPDDKESIYRSARQMQVIVDRALRTTMAFYETEGYYVDPQDLTNEMMTEQNKRAMWVSSRDNIVGKNLFEDLIKSALKANALASLKKRDNAKRMNASQYFSSLLASAGVKFGK